MYGKYDNLHILEPTLISWAIQELHKLVTTGLKDLFVNSVSRGRVMHTCISKLTIIVSGLSPGWHRAIIWTNTGILLIGTLGTKSQ